MHASPGAHAEEEASALRSALRMLRDMRDGSSGGDRTRMQVGSSSSALGARCLQHGSCGMQDSAHVYRRKGGGPPLPQQDGLQGHETSHQLEEDPAAPLQAHREPTASSSIVEKHAGTKVGEAPTGREGPAGPDEHPVSGGPEGSSMHAATSAWSARRSAWGRSPGDGASGRGSGRRLQQIYAGPYFAFPNSVSL